MPYRYRNTLVVDDELSIHEMYDICLKPFPEAPRYLAPEGGTTAAAQNAERNFRILHAAGGEEAINVAKAQTDKDTPIQVAFVDLKMSPLDGVDTIKALHEIDPRIIFVVVTGLPQKAVDEILSELESIAIQVVLKPFTGKRIYEVATELCERWRRDYAD